MKRILKLLLGIFEDKSDRDAYVAAMKDIEEYRRSMITYRTVGLNKNTLELEFESYVGKTKKQCKEEFIKIHPDVFVTYVKSFGVEEPERYYQYLHYMDTMAENYKLKKQRRK